MADTYIPIWMIWMMVVGGAFLVGVGIGYLLQGPETWRPWKKKERRIRSVGLPTWMRGDESA